MARIRSIKPEFFKSETLSLLPIPARMTFIGLWTEADDAGRLVDNSKLLKGSLWPLDDDVTAVDVSLHIHMLADVGLVERYEVEGRRYLHVCGWDEHQKINRPSPSKHPAPPSQVPHPQDTVNPHGILTETSPGERKGKEHGKDHQRGECARTEPPPVDNPQPDALHDDETFALEALRIAAPGIAAQNGAAKPAAYARTVITNGRTDRIPDLIALRHTHKPDSPEALARLYLATDTPSAPPARRTCTRCHALTHTIDQCPLKERT